MRNGDYILVIAPVGYSGKIYRGRYCYEHHLVWWINTGEVVEEEYCVHHIDENRHNNSFTNLRKMLRKDHLSLHGIERGKPTQVTHMCPVCNRAFVQSGSRYNTMVKTYGRDYTPCCSRSCQVRKQQADIKKRK